MALFKFWVLCVFAIATAESDSPSVIIIGAGPSGIAAATKLLENSITNITILEAENRIGGRIYSVALEDGYVDVGAEYCHGDIGNVVFDRVKSLNLLKRDNVVFELYYSDGSKIKDEIANDFLQLPNLDLNSENNLNMGQSAMELFNSTFANKYKPSTKPKISELPKLLEHMLISFEGAFSWNTPVTNGHYETTGDNQYIWKSGGYHTILDVLIKKIPNPKEKLPLEDKVLLNKEVTNVSWEDNKAQIKTLDGSVYTADHVIFTPSIGVLKYTNGLFKPSLPKKKLDALNALGFDAVIKINVHYSQKWLNGNPLLIWSADDLSNSAKDFPHGYSKDGISWISSVFGFSQAANPNVLVAWVSGSMVPHIEQIPEETIKDGIYFVTNKFFGQEFNVSRPDKVIRSQWYSNPHFRGTYSYEKSDQYKKEISNQAILAEPLYNKNGEIVVQFAGEGTNPIHFSTVHGAIETGWREAKRIISVNKKPK